MRFKSRIRRAIKKKLAHLFSKWLRGEGYFVSRYQPGEKERKIVLSNLLNDGVARVQSGPFEGMYIDVDAKSWGDGGIVVRLLGSVESELHASLNKFYSQPPEQIVNLGCAEGYYAVGSALRAPGSRILAIDIDPNALEACRRNAELNNVDERISFFSSAEGAKAHFQPNSLWIVDIEGNEYELLDTQIFPEIRSSQLVIELHAPYESPRFEDFMTKISRTHQTIIIESAGRNPNAYKILQEMPDSIKWPIMGEGRMYGMKWLVAEPRDS